MLKLSLVVMFILSLVTLSIAASTIPPTPAPAQLVQSNL